MRRVRRLRRLCGVSNLRRNRRPVRPIGYYRGRGRSFHGSFRVVLRLAPVGPPEISHPVWTVRVVDRGNSDPAAHVEAEEEYDPNVDTAIFEEAAPFNACFSKPEASALLQGHLIHS